jgi:hypothetical protein
MVLFIEVLPLTSGVAVALCRHRASESIDKRRGIPATHLILGISLATAFNTVNSLFRRLHVNLQFPRPLYAQEDDNMAAPNLDNRVGVS